ncbi:MAG: hypothetical protein ACRC6O_06645 [Flavobacterium sp.]
MENKKEINSFQCFLTNAGSFSKNIDLNATATSTVINQIIHINENPIQEKSASDTDIEQLNLQLIHKQKPLTKPNRLYKKEMHKGLEEIMFMISHKIRLPLTNILGLSNLLTINSNSIEENTELIELIKKSATDLDMFTKELALFINKLDSKRDLHNRK